LPKIAFLIMSTYNYGYRMRLVWYFIGTGESEQKQNIKNDLHAYGDEKSDDQAGQGNQSPLGKSHKYKWVNGRVKKKIKMNPQNFA